MTPRHSSMRLLGGAAIGLLCLLGAGWVVGVTVLLIMLELMLGVR